MTNMQNDTQENLLPKDGETFFFAHFFTAEESSFYFETLLKEIAWKEEPIIIFGKKIMQPRLTAWYGEAGKAYSYSGITMQPNLWTPTLLQIKERIESTSGVIFNSALLNFYRDGQDSNGWHSDNEKELGVNPVIGSVSFGASRTFKFKHRRDKRLNCSVDLANGSFLLMKGPTQHHWLHCIPKTKKVVESRINITFRIIV